LLGRTGDNPHAYTNSGSNTNAGSGSNTNADTSTGTDTWSDHIGDVWFRKRPDIQRTAHN
jgi:hypothetical protein